MYTVNFVLGVLAVFLSIFIQENDAATCSSYTTENTCQQSALCAWRNNACGCNATVPLEVVFVMDSSGSVQSTGWTQEKNFVVGMVETGIAPSAHVGIVVFSTKTTINLDFNGDQSRSSIKTLVNKLAFMARSTYTLNGMMAAFKVFYRSTQNKQRMIFLITDGSPNPPDSQNPCTTNAIYTNATNLRLNLTRWNITTILVTVGPDIKPATLSCLYGGDTSRVISAVNFDASSFESIRPQTDAYLCPTNTNFRLSELRVEVGGDGGNSRFIELYNEGDFYDFSGNNMVLSGYVTGTITSGSIAKGKRLVIYDASNSDMKCQNCTCTGLSNGRCGDAVYIGCGSGEQSCTFDSSMNNDYWNQIVSDTLDQTTWINVKHNSSNSATDLVTVSNGYTFENINLLGNPSESGNWKMSCTKYGTPGAAPLADCPLACTDDKCQANGDTGGACDGDVCVCTTSNHYYPSGTQCLLLEPPENCITQVLKDEYENQYGQVVWDDVDALKFVDHFFEISYTYDAPTTVTTAEGSGITYVVYGGTTAEITGHSPPTVKTALTISSGTIYSEATTCNFVTESPTMSPSPSPTKVPTKTPTSGPTTQPTKQPTKQPTVPPTNPPTLRPTVRPTAFPTVSGYQITSCAIEVASGSESITVTFGLDKYTDVEDTDLDLTLQLNLNGDTSSSGAYQLAGTTSPQTQAVVDGADPTYWLWPRYFDRVGGSYVGYDRGHECTVTTQIPTPAPTKKPTNPPTKKPTSPPTKKPTGPPTKRPTSKPTYKFITVPNCQVLLGRYKQGKIQDFEITFTEATLDSETVSQANLLYDIRWGSSSDQVDHTGSGVVTYPITKEIALTDEVTITPVDLSGNEVGDTTVCEVKTQAPSLSPTPAPQAPTQSPITPSIGFNTDNCEAGNGNAYVCSYEIQQGAYDVQVDLLSRAVDYSVSYTWSITFDSSVEEGFTLSSNEAIATEEDFNNVLEGDGTIGVQEQNNKLALYVVSKSNAEADAVLGWLVLESCTFQSSTCTRDPTKSLIRVRITNNGGESKTVDVNKGKMPMWVWYPIAAGILILAGLAAFGYMYYNKRKLAEEQLQQREADLANAEELDNLENFGGLGDNINFNPIATAGTQDVATGGEYIDKQLAKQQKHAEFAQVDVDKEVWRQDFGQVKADRHMETDRHMEV